MENLSLSPDDLFTEIADVARAQGALTKDAWDDLVATLLEDKREFLEIDDDEDIVQLTEALKSRFTDFLDSVDTM